METLMAGAATLEIFLASLGMAVALGSLALRGALWLMHGAGTGGRGISRVRPRVAGGTSALAQVRVGHGHLSLRMR